jgi:hypothetical protein
VVSVIGPLALVDGSVDMLDRRPAIRLCQTGPTMDGRENAGIQSLHPGWWVALTLRADTAKLRVYVGQVQALDDRGVRITLIDWFVGSASSWDFFAPWDSIVSTLIATDEHEHAGFGEAASSWQSDMNEDPAETLLSVIDERIEVTDDEEERSRLAKLRESFSAVGESVASALVALYLKRVAGI